MENIKLSLFNYSKFIPLLFGAFVLLFSNLFANTRGKRRFVAALVGLMSATLLGTFLFGINTDLIFSLIFGYVLSVIGLINIFHRLNG